MIFSLVGESDTFPQATIVGRTACRKRKTNYFKVKLIRILYQTLLPVIRILVLGDFCYIAFYEYFVIV